MVGAAVTEDKLKYAERMNALLDKYSKVVFVGVDNVQSQQMHAVRRSLRGKGELLMGKKTMQKKIISLRGEADGASDTDKLLVEKFVNENLLKNNCGLIFTNDDLSVINEVILNNRVQAPARVGAISPVDVIVPAGNTGLEPTVTSFFQALNIMTKISKGTVEIVTDKKVLSVGEKVDNSVATLLQKLKINPFFYGLDVWCVWDRGVIFTKEDLKTTDDDIAAAFSSGIANITALSLGAGVPTEASFPHLVIDAFKNLLGVSLETNYEFTEFNGAVLRKNIKEGKTAPAAAPAAKAAAPAAAAAKAPAKKEPEPEPEDDDDVGLGGLF